MAEYSRPIGSNTVTISYLHTDALGSPIARTNAAGTVTEASEYEPYGKLLNGPNDDRAGYTGHVMDAATGLTFMQQRYYDPQIGRFLSVDPVTAYSSPGANFNRYWYANNNPYKFTDPDGRLAFLAPLAPVAWRAGVGFVAGAGAEIVMQMASGKSLSEVDKSDVLVSGLVGATLGGPVGAGGKAVTTTPKIADRVKAIQTLNEQAKRAQTASRAAKIEGRIQDNTQKATSLVGDVAETAAKAAVGVGVKHTVQESINSSQKPSEPPPPPPEPEKRRATGG